MNKAKPTLQKYIFENLMSHFKKKSDAISRLAELFSLHPDGVYKRMNGDFNLKPDEIETIASKFKISLDAHVFSDSDSVLFQFNPFVKTIRNFDDYVNELYNAVKPLSELNGLMLHSASSELPIFYFLSSPALFSFKMFVWARSVWNFEHIRKEKFSFNLISPSTLEKAHQIWGIYEVQNTFEMWSLNILDSTLNQIEYYYSIKMFRNKMDVLILCNALSELVFNLETMVAQSKKATDENASTKSFKLYHNEINFTNNTILIESDTANIVYCNFVIPDYLRTTDVRIVEYTRHWFEDIISKSTQISAQSKKGRQYFFETLIEKIERLKGRIEKNEGNNAQ